MKRKNILEGIGVLLIVAILMASSIVVTADTMDKQEMTTATSLDINVRGGLGVTAEFTNTGTEPITDMLTHIQIFGDIYINGNYIFTMINVHAKKTMSLDPGETKTLRTGIFFGLAKIDIDVIADTDEYIVEEYTGQHLFIFTSLLK